MIQVDTIDDWAQNIVSAVSSAGAEMFKWLTGGASSDSGSFWPATVVEGMTSVLSAAGSVASVAASFIGSVVETAGSVISNVGSAIVGAVSSVGNAIGNVIASIFCWGWWCRRNGPQAAGLKSQMHGAAQIKSVTGSPGDSDKRRVAYSCLTTGSVYTSLSGTVSDGAGDYGNDADCYWVIAVPGHEITLTFTSLDTEANFDTISVFSCPTPACTTTTELQGSPFSGTTLPTPLVSSTGYLRIALSSDSSLTGGGFEALYSTLRIVGSASATSKCPASGTVLTTPNGTLTDGPGDYENYIECFVVISLPGRTISVKFTSLDTQLGHDFVRVESCISEACASTTPIGGSPFSGSVLPASIECTTGFVKISLATDGLVTGGGFVIQYSSTEQVSEVHIDTYLNHVLSSIPEGATLGISLKFAVASDDTAGMDALHAAIGQPGSRRSGVTSQLFSSSSGWEDNIWGAVEIHSVSTTSLKDGLQVIESRKVAMPQELTGSSSNQSATAAAGPAESTPVQSSSPQPPLSTDASIIIRLIAVATSQ
jgi:hypothetical protein